MTENVDSQGEGRPLALRTPDLKEIDSDVAGHEPDQSLVAQADSFVHDVLALTGGARPRDAVDGMGIEVQQQAAHRSAMLQQPIRRLAHQGDDGGPVANALVELRTAMADLDPRHHRLTTGGLASLLGRIPGVGTPLQRYFRRFESAQEALDAIIRDLQSGKDMLRRDNLTLTDDQEVMRGLLTELSDQIRLGRLIDERFVAAADQAGESERRAFIEEELLFPLRQRITDLQQQLAVTQQGVLALEVIIRNNRELMRGVDRAINVTVSALNVAVTVAMALANQKLVLDRVEGLNATTADMIAGTAEKLRTQGVDIQTRASSATLDMEKLEHAFVDVMGAIEELSRYRREALPRLDEQIDRLENLTDRGRAAVERLDQGNNAAEVAPNQTPER